MLWDSGKNSLTVSCQLFQFCILPIPLPMSCFLSSMEDLALGRMISIKQFPLLLSPSVKNGMLTEVYPKGPLFKGVHILSVHVHENLCWMKIKWNSTSETIRILTWSHPSWQKLTEQMMKIYLTWMESKVLLFSFHRPDVAHHQLELIAEEVLESQSPRGNWIQHQRRP